MLATCVLHNVLLWNSGGYITQQSLICESTEQGSVKSEELSGNALTPLQGSNQPWVTSGHEVRETFKNDFLH